MPSFSASSKAKLAECHSALQDLFNSVILEYDCTVVCGFRGKEAQNKAFSEGKSKLKWPMGKHNKTPSLAVDVVPFIKGKISWDVKECIKFGQFVLSKAKELNIPIRWGGDFNRDGNPLNDKFADYPHFELI